MSIIVVAVQGEQMTTARKIPVALRQVDIRVFSVDQSPAFSSP